MAFKTSDPDPDPCARPGSVPAQPFRRAGLRRTFHRWPPRHVTFSLVRLRRPPIFHRLYALTAIDMNASSILLENRGQRWLEPKLRLVARAMLCMFSWWVEKASHSLLRGG